MVTNKNFNTLKKTGYCLQSKEIVLPKVESENQQMTIKDDPIDLGQTLNTFNKTLQTVEIKPEENVTQEGTIRLLAENMQQPQDNTYQQLSIHWCQKLTKMGNTQRIFAEKLINDVLFNGELGLLNFNTSITNLSPHQGIHIT